MSQNIEELKTRLAKLLVEKSYKEGDFTLSSGRKSEYYFDCKQTALHPEGSWLIGHLFCDMLKDLNIVGIGGMTLGADPIISAVSTISYETKQNLAGFIVRKTPKSHGTEQYVEGLTNFAPMSKVAMVEDVVTSGGSVLTASERVVAAGLDIQTICTVLDRGEGGKEAIIQAGYNFRSLFTRQELLVYANKK